MIRDVWISVGIVYRRKDNNRTKTVGNCVNRTIAQTTTGNLVLQVVER